MRRAPQLRTFGTRVEHEYSVDRLTEASVPRFMNVQSSATTRSASIGNRSDTTPCSILVPATTDSAIL